MMRQGEERSNFSNRPSDQITSDKIPFKMKQRCAKDTECLSNEARCDSPKKTHGEVQMSGRNVFFHSHGHAQQGGLQLAVLPSLFVNRKLVQHIIGVEPPAWNTQPQRVREHHQDTQMSIGCASRKPSLTRRKQQKMNATIGELWRADKRVLSWTCRSGTQ